MSSCVDCPNHRVMRDPDPDDWFNDDDEKLVCTIAQRSVTTACRPYNLRKETNVPEWCPLIKGEKT